MEYFTKDLHQECSQYCETFTCQRWRRICSQVRVKNPFPSGYRLELYVTDELGLELVLQFMQMIGILCWAVELSCIDIFLKVSLLSQYQANPRLGHLEAAYHIFVYLKKHLDMGWIVFDAKIPDVDETVFNLSADWFYSVVKEELPPNMPELRGRPVTFSAFVDANHAGNVMTHHLHSGILIFVQNAPIIWFSK